MKLPGDNNNMRSGGLTIEDEMNLDGMIVSASFDEPLEMVGHRRHGNQPPFTSAIV